MVNSSNILDRTSVWLVTGILNGEVAQYLKTAYESSANYVWFCEYGKHFFEISYVNFACSSEFCNPPFPLFLILFHSFSFNNFA